MSTKRRANFSAKEKVAILRERLIEGKPISEVCEAHGIQALTAGDRYEMAYEKVVKILNRGSDTAAAEIPQLRRAEPLTSFA